LDVYPTVFDILTQLASK